MYNFANFVDGLNAVKGVDSYQDPSFDTFNSDSITGLVLTLFSGH